MSAAAAGRLRLGARRRGRGRPNPIRQRPPHVRGADGALRQRRRGTEERPRRAWRSAPRVAKWLGDIREFFPAPWCRSIQKDAFERKGLQPACCSSPNSSPTVEADVNLIADLIALRGVMPEKTKDTARHRRRQGGRRADGAARAPDRGRASRRAQPLARTTPPALCRHRLAAHHQGQSPATTSRSIAPWCPNG